ncbi:MAG: TlpA disulfide reductase family protein [Flavobacteriaceae bacterium]|nr:AhpC/TSA family protein [Flavobacteriaceae bacterium]
MKKLIFIFTLLPTFLMAQYTIKGTFSPADEYNYALLYKVTPESMVYVNNAEIKAGKFTFKLDSTVTKGMYRLVYALPQEEYNFDIIYNAKENIELAFDQEIGVNFIKSVENNLIGSYTRDMEAIGQSIGDYFKSTSKDTLSLVKIFKKQAEIQSRYEKTAKGTIASVFIKANKPYIPKKYETVKEYVRNFKDYYFSYIDFNNELLQSSNFLSERITSYVFGMTDENKDDLETYRANIDDVFEEMQEAKLSTKKSLLTILWQQMADLSLETTANYISDKYLIPIAEKTQDKALVEALKKFKNTSLGTVAPDFSFEKTFGDVTTKTKLSALNTANQYVVVFWSSSCSHCMQEIPQLQKFIKVQQKGKLQVIAIGLEDSSTNWKKLIGTYPEFIHVLGLGKWTNKLSVLYNVNATPTYFVLDKDKKIIAKPNDIIELREHFSN